VTKRRFVQTREIVCPIPSAPPLHGWGIRLLSDIEKAGWKKGFWLSKWTIAKDSLDAAFSGGSATLVFNQQADAEGAAALLKRQDIETEVVKIGDPPQP
jgi:hypothetical protein